jgi:hypothetical protein
MKGFVGLHDFVERLGTQAQCEEWIRMCRWPNGFRCPRCSETKRVSYIRTRRKWQCNACKYQCSLIAGTIFENTKLPLQKWFLAAYFILTTKKGISGPDLARKIDVGQDTAWFLREKITCVLDRLKALSLFGVVEVDETFIGGKKPGGKPGRGTTQEPVVGMVEAYPGKLGQARFHHVPDASAIVLETVIREEISPGATIKTDAWRGYRNLTGYHHIPRKQRKGKEGRDLPAVHLLFANFKRIIKGVHVHVSTPKLQRYLDLFEYRYNYRDNLWGGFYNAAIHLTDVPPRRYQQLKAAATAL